LSKEVCLSGTRTDDVAGLGLSVGPRDLREGLGAVELRTQLEKGGVGATGGGVAVFAMAALSLE